MSADGQSAANEHRRWWAIPLVAAVLTSLPLLLRGCWRFPATPGLALPQRESSRG